MRFVAVTRPVNNTDEPLRLTKEQVYAGLKVKARDPIRFVAVIEHCNVLNEHTTGLLREVQFKNKPESVHENVEYFPSEQVTFTMFHPKTGEQLAHITNLISTLPDGELLLTFAFAWGPNGPLDEGAEAEKEEKEREKLGFETIEHTLVVIRDLVKSKDI
ncbi:uncharacterized protein C8Q71DRAFT_740049 [Rhodofomes roseus]|uniref:Uncharacterized protein n=1 Tax=Rhodofomes roseus TaxID=34475 RepID=A0ABQ8KR20_9APHY|nr:uncharacterized protein C8Q71DRAFT_740049 [Rhodofomes roseus]KAH9840565.1 hypothetical protein C8Q71DRAFT_740049 [Rhodofomes roseus]